MYPAVVLCIFTPSLCKEKLAKKSRCHVFNQDLSLLWFSCSKHTKMNEFWGFKSSAVCTELLFEWFCRHTLLSCRNMVGVYYEFLWWSKGIQAQGGASSGHQRCDWKGAEQLSCFPPSPHHSRTGQGYPQHWRFRGVCCVFLCGE